MLKLKELYEHPAVKELGEAIGKAVGDEDTQDYASLVDIEFAQESQEFADALHRFLRRFLTFVGRKGWYCPSAERISELMQLVDSCADEFNNNYREAIRIVRAALLSRALAQACYLKRQKGQLKSTQGGRS